MRTILLAICLWSGCAFEPETQEEIGSARAALAPDPGAAGTYTACPAEEQEFGGTKARIFYARNGTCANAVYGPLVLIIHAAGAGGYEYDTYDYLQTHLARNGYISVSLDVEAATIDPSDQEAAAEQAWDFVEDYLWTSWPRRTFINPDSVALIGHSRGGVTVRYLAQHVAGDPVFRVRSVVSLAPGSDAGTPITGLDTVAFLQLYGTSDGDTSPHSTFGYYDEAGDEGSQRDVAVNDEVLYKVIKLAVGATHAGYAGDTAPAGSQRRMVQGYVLAFLEAHNHDNIAYYEDYIRANNKPGGYAPRVFTTHSDGYYRRVIDNFDDGFLDGSTIGGEISTFNATAQVLDLADEDNNVHRTHALWTWGAGNGSLVTWTIPAGAMRNASAFEWLSLRIAQTSGAPATGLRIQIRNGAVWSPEIPLTNYGQPVVGELPQPTLMCFVQLGADCQDYEHMATLRIPLSAFGAHNDVQFVRLVFRGDAFPDTFIVDNLEFSEWIFKP
jgi:hypothetical protein